MFKMNSDDVFKLLVNDPLALKIQRTFKFLIFFIFLVIEVDIPWDASQVAEYGQYFHPWAERRFKKLCKSLVTNLQTIPFTILVYE